MVDADMKTTLLFLQSPDPAENIRGIERLVDMASSSPETVEAAIPHLILLLRKSDRAVVLVAVKAVGKIAPSVKMAMLAMPHLLEMLGGEDNDIASAAYSTLGVIGKIDPDRIINASSDILFALKAKPHRLEDAIPVLEVIFPGSRGELRRIADMSLEACREAVNCLINNDISSLTNITDTGGNEGPDSSRGSEGQGPLSGDIDIDEELKKRGISEETFEELATYLMKMAQSAYERGAYVEVETYTRKIEQLAARKSELLHRMQLEETIGVARRAIEIAKSGSAGEGGEDFHVKEIFYVYRNGVLISHISGEGRSVDDTDIVSSMLTAIQDFVRDAFSQGGDEAEEDGGWLIKNIQFGEHNIRIERGMYSYIAVVYEGEQSPMLDSVLADVISEIEDMYEPVLRNWSGAVDRIGDVRGYLARILELGEVSGNEDGAD